MVVAMLVGGSVGARADVAQACSEPTGAVCATSDIGTDISKDRDGDYTTATTSQVVTAFYAVANQSTETQTVHVRLILDGPGTSEDTAFIGGWVMEPDEIRQGSIELFKVHKKNTPAGEYTWTVTARGVESVSAMSTATVYF
jgi:hypothetical protein